MTTSRLASVVRRLAGRRWFGGGRWGRSRRLAGAGMRLSLGGVSEAQPVQGPRPPQGVREPDWARFDDSLALKTTQVPHLAATLPPITATLAAALAQDGKR
jgi:hypothetical protein